MPHRSTGGMPRPEAGDEVIRVPFLDLTGMTAEVADEVTMHWQRLLAGAAFVGGQAVDDFERQWSTYCGTTECVGVGNGTDALRLALTALGVGGGDEVIVPANTFVATVEAICLAGAVPRFADVDEDTLLLTADSVRAAITSRSTAVIVVQLYGQMADMDAIGAVAARAGLAVVEDAAQAHGASWRGRRSGSFGVAGCFSFYPAKNLGAFGDAGAVVTSDSVLAGRIRSLRDHGRIAGSHYEHDLIGTNSRLDAVQAAVLSAKLAHLDQWIEARVAVGRTYRAVTAGTAFRMVADTPRARSAWHLAVVRVLERDRARHLLDSLGVATMIHYPRPCHLLTPYRKFADGPLRVAERAASEVLSLPMFPHLSGQQIAHVCDAIRAVDELCAARRVVHV